MKDVSVEYAHIYSNSEIAEEHHTALDILGKVKDKLDKEAESFSLIVLVDDYSFPDPTFDYNAFSQWLADKGYKPDYMYRESQLIPVCDQVIELVEDKKLKDKLVSYIKAKKYPCSLFVSAWYLLRLGALEHDSFDKGIVANRLINILPESFKPFEDQAMEIIKSTKHADLANSINYEFIEGRLLA